MGGTTNILIAVIIFSIVLITWLCFISRLSFGHLLTMQRRIRRAVGPVLGAPKVLGVDDWAKRKGQKYGTILIDLEQHSIESFISCAA